MKSGFDSGETEVFFVSLFLLSIAYFYLECEISVPAFIESEGIFLHKSDEMDVLLGVNLRGFDLDLLVCYELRTGWWFWKANFFHLSLWIYIAQVFE